jgi:hypothetical protein
MNLHSIINEQYKYDFEYFLESFQVQIELNINERSNFKLRAYQKKILDSLLIYNRHMVISPRQTGISTLMCLFLIKEILIGSCKNIGIFVPKIAMGLHSIEIIKNIYSSISDDLKLGIKRSCKNNITFDNNKQITVISPHSMNVENGNCDIMWFDNFSSISYINQERIKREILPNLESKSDNKIIFTTNGFDGLDPLYLFLNDNERYTRHDINWSEVPGRDDEWKQEMINTIGQPAFQKEYEICCK